MTTLIAKLGAENVDWVGTSMGGIIGMILASLPGSPVRKLVMNDVGCMIPKAAIERIGQYVGNDPPFDSLEALEAAMRTREPVRRAHRRAVAPSRDARRQAGRATASWRFRYDPGIARELQRARRPPTSTCAPTGTRCTARCW